MRIQLFNNKKGLIYGNDVKRIECDRDGVLKIGDTEIEISSADTIMPVLFGGSKGVYIATFTDKVGDVFDLGKVTIRAGRIEPPDPIAVEFMDLRCQIDALERTCEEIKAQVYELSNIFDTNSLNFIIKGETK